VSLSTEATAHKVKAPAESILYGFAMDELLNDDETYTGTPSVTCVAVDVQVGAASAGATTDLTFGSPLVNTATFEDDEGNTVAVGEGIQCRINGGLLSNWYQLLISCGTSDGNTRAGYAWLEVAD
jgi:hypothetical protein